MRTLIIYGTRQGSTAKISKEIARVLREAGFDVKVINAKMEKPQNISEYELVVVGSGVQMGKWAGEAEYFLKKFRKDLATKKVALFVSSAIVPMLKKRGENVEIERARKRYLEDKAANYSLNPIAMEIFGGMMDFNKMGFLARRTFGWLKPSFEATGYKETKPGVYDTRDWNEVTEWAQKLVLKARYL